MNLHHEWESAFAAWAGSEHFEGAEWHTHRSGGRWKQHKGAAEKEKSTKKLLDKAMGIQEGYVRRV